MSASKLCPECGNKLLPGWSGFGFICASPSCTYYIPLMMTTAVEEQPDCHCGHSWYDHIGWRMVNGEYDRSNCRIVQCGCECYTEKRAYEYEALQLHTAVPPNTFNPNCTYGNTIRYSGKYTAIPQDVKDVLHNAARCILPTGQYYEIRGDIPVHYGRKELCWVYEPHMAGVGIRWNADLDPPEIHLGYHIIGGYFA